MNFLVGNFTKQSTDNVAIDPAKSYYPSLTCFSGLDKKTEVHRWYKFYFTCMANKNGSVGCIQLKYY